MELNESNPVDIRLEEYAMDMEEVARILPHIDGWLAWANAFKKYALEAARDKGEKIEGYKVVRGRANRAWNPDKDVVAELRAAEVSETDIFPPSDVPRSVAQLEKVLGKSAFTKLAESRTLVITPLGTPALVPESDSRPAVNAAAEARAAFSVTTKTEDKDK